MRHLALAILLVGCGSGGGHAQSDAAAPGGDAPAASDAPAADTPATGDAPAGDGSGTPDAAPDAPAGVITGGPCISGATGATAYRVRWADAGGTAQVVYEVNGLPDHSRDHAGAFGFQIGFVPQFVDPFLGDGGLQLDSDDFVDLELTTAGVSAIGN